MAEEPIRKDDILDFEGTLKGIKDIIDAFESLNTTLKKDLITTVIELTKDIQSYNTATKEGQTNLKNASDATGSLVAQQKALNKLDTETVQLKARLNALNTDEAKTIAELKVAIQNKTAALKTDAQAENNAAGSINDLKAKVKALTAEYNALAPAIAKDALPALKELNEKLIAAQAATGVHTRGVGDYTNAIKNAASQIFAFITPIAAATYALNGLKTAFAGTEAGANLLGRAKLQMTAFFDAIVEGKWKYAFGTELPKDIKEIADLQNKVRIDERKEIVEISEKEKEIKDLKIEAYKAGKDSVKEADLLKQAVQKENELTVLKLAHKQEELKYINLILDKDPVNTAALNKQAQLEAEINNIKGDRSERLASREESAQQKIIANTEKQKKAEEEKTKKIEEEYKKQIKLKQETALDELSITKQTSLGEESTLVKQAELKAVFDRDNALRETQSVESQKLGAKENAETQKLIWIKYYADIAKIQEEETKKLLDKEWENGTKAAKAMYDENKKAAKENWDAMLRADKIKEETEDMILKDQLARGLISQKDYLKEKRDDEIAYAKESIKNENERNAPIAKIQEKYEEDERKRKAELQRNIENAVLTGAQAGADAIFSARKDRLNAEMNAELSNTNLTENQKDEIKKKYARLQQKQNITQAIINGALAITKTFADYGFTPAAWVAAALVAVQTGIQVAVIRAQRFAHGGSGIVNGPVHASGGVAVPGVGIVEGGEHFAVTSRAMTSKYGASMLDAVSKSINQGKFFEVWANVNKDMGISDPYTKKMYDLMKNTPTTYIDTEGNTVKEYPSGRKDIIKRIYRN
jgi:hypothetical protein